MLDAIVTFTTPEGVTLSAPLASPLRRMWALVIDLLVLALLLAGLAWLVLFAFSRVVLGLGALAAFVLLWGYFFVGEYFCHGKTLGKYLLRLRVVNDDFTPLTLSAALWRNVLRYVDFLPGCFGIGLFFVLFSPRQQRCGDWLAGTVVIADAPPPAPEKPLHTPPEALPWDLRPEEKLTLMAFARYAEQVDPVRAAEMAAVFAPLLPADSPAQRVRRLCAFAAGCAK